MVRREHSINIYINERYFEKVVIDPHYELKHSESICDNLILELVMQLDEGDFDPDSVSGSFEYYITDYHILSGKKYRLLWLIENEIGYIGVINAYRR